MNTLNTNIEIDETVIPRTPEFMNAQELRDDLRDRVEKNDRTIRDILTRENGIIRLTERLKSLEDWRQIRSWLQLLKDYADILSYEDKKILLLQYYDMMVHPNGTVRRIVAENIGLLLAGAEPEKNNLWDSFLRKMLFPDNSLSNADRNRIGYALKSILETMLSSVDEKEKRLVLNDYVSYFKSTRWDRDTCLSLLKGIRDIPYDCWNNLQRHYIIGFIRQFMSKEEEEIRIVALRLIRDWLDQGMILQDDMRQYLESLSLREDVPENENYLIISIRQRIGCDEADTMVYQPADSAELIRRNLEFNTFGTDKVINMAILKERFHSMLTDSQDLSLYATHLLNVLRLNTDAEIFLPAGEDLVEVMPRLEEHQKIEVIHEILKDVELGVDSINYVPSFLGRTYHLLGMEDQKDIFVRFEQLFNSGKPSIMKLTLEVIECILQYFPEFLNRQTGQEDFFLEEFRFFTGMLCRGMAYFRKDVSDMAILLMGNVLSHCRNLPSSYREDIFCLVRKTVICLTGREQSNYHLLFTRTMNNACQLLTTRVMQDMSAADTEKKRKIAFFSRSFDPFSRRDRSVVREICQMGYEVYLHAHDFAWYKNTQPLGIRYQMIHMSIADMKDVYLFPEQIPINLTNASDRRKLKKLFPEREIYIVIGTNGIKNNEAYWAEPGEDSIHTFPHILYTQGEARDMMDAYTIRHIISGDVIFLRMPSYLQDLDSKTVRRRVMAGKEIDTYVNEQVCQMIQSWNLYRDWPAYKDAAMTRSIEKAHHVKEPGIYRMGIYDETDEDHRVLRGEILYRSITLTGLYRIFKDADITEALRGKMSGRIAYILEISGEVLSEGENVLEDYRQTALNEMLAYVQKHEYSYAVCTLGEEYEEILRLQGFLPLEGHKDCFILDMTAPIALFSEVNLRLKEPFSKEPEIRRAIFSGRKKLLKSMTDLYPGHLILNFEMDIINYRMIRLLQDISQQFPSRRMTVSEGNGNIQKNLKECICVPFGKSLKNVQIPRMITKELNTEKLYTADLKSFDICEFAEYPSLHAQIRTIRSFSKPIILIDDLYHKGNRVNKIQQILNEENMEIHTIAVGVLSGKGNDLAQMSRQKVKAVHTIPNLRCWFQESDMCPFIGGDGLESNMGDEEHITILPSINSLMPYQIPSYLKGASMESIYALSMASLEYTKNLYMVLEACYQKISHSTLTMDKIGEVITEPRAPGELMTQTRYVSRKVSEVLEQEISRLKRMRHIVNYAK